MPPEILQTMFFLLSVFLVWLVKDRELQRERRRFHESFEGFWAQVEKCPHCSQVAGAITPQRPEEKENG